MNLFNEKYVDPRTDYGFKYLFGTDVNKELLISFLNSIFEGKMTITDVSYLKNEHMGNAADKRRAIFDVYCQTSDGDYIIVEMQNVNQQFFKDRSVYYSTFPIVEQAKRGEWDFNLKAVYTIGILNFCFNDEEDEEERKRFFHEVKLMDTKTLKVFYDKLTFYYLELPKFTKTENELSTLFDKWAYVLRNLPKLLSKPAALQERVFTTLFKAAEIACFPDKERDAYEYDLKGFRDNINTTNYLINTAREEAKAEGRAEGRAEGMEIGEKRGKLQMAKMMKTNGEATDKIMMYTGLSAEEIGTL